MPRRSSRRKFVQQILLKAAIDIIWAKSDSEVNDELLNCSSQILCVLKHRYFSPRSNFIPKSTDWYIHILPEYDDNRFKSCLRVTREDFKALLEMISLSKAFKTSAKTIKVEKQLAITLFRFGCEGAGVSYYKIGQTFGVSEGAIFNSTRRVIKALLEKEREVITWPGTDERQAIVAFMDDKLPGCIGYVDGCHIPLYEAPSDHHESYFSRKQQYGLQLQAVCDNDLMIRSISVGYPASAHDARVYANSPLGMHPEKYFGSGEWIAGDSAYKLTSNVLTPFRDNSKHGTTTQRRAYNRHFSSFRVKIEHTFGILKKVFGSLKSLRVRVDSANGHRRACEWIRACCVVYNIIKPVEDPEQESNANDTTPTHFGQQTIQGEERRRELFNWINDI